MAYPSNDELLARWFSELGRTDARWLTRSANYRVDKETGMLTFVRVVEAGRMPRREQMGMMVGNRFNGGVVLLNGDGLDNWEFTEAQTRLRERVQREFGWQRAAIIPYQAMRGAQIDLDSFKAIQITQDRNDTFWVPLAPAVFGERHSEQLVALANSNPPGWEVVTENSTSKNMVGEIEGVRINISFTRTGRSAPWQVYVLNVWAQPEFGRHDWQRCSYVAGNYTNVRGPNNEAIQEVRQGWGWTENVHRLGSVVFSAVSRTDGARHRYLSSFDMQEPGGLYFLAMLPSKGKCSTYEEAIDLLCPQIVKLNRENGKEVFRQGDVFAIETDLTDAQVYEGALTRVTRGVVMQDTSLIQRSGGILIPPSGSEVWEYGSCPFCDSKKHRVGNGPRARAALSIHGTGHTANEVVVKENGVTFIRGFLFHDPQIEDPTRAQPDHQPIALGNAVAGNNRIAIGTRHEAWLDALNAPTKPKWFLAVRNTVPRVRRRRDNPSIELPREQVVAEPAVEHRDREVALSL